jgi:hypothetical protein
MWNIIWPPMRQGYSFLAEFCPGIPFSSFIRFLLEQFYTPIYQARD